MKKIFILLLMFVPLLSLRAQTDFARAVVPTGGQAGNVSYSFGQPFYRQLRSATGAEVSEGVQQAQFLYRSIDTALCQNDVRPICSFNFHSLDADGSLIPEGRYDSSHYCPSFLNYDSLTDITLTVWPIYEGWDTLRVQYADLESIGFHEGRNDKLMETVNGCDSLMHYMVYVCGFPNVADGDHNIYGNTWVGNECWTSSNLHTTHDNDGNTVPNMVYRSREYTDTNRMVDTYGRIYTWYAAVTLPDNSTDVPVTTDEGFVRGICPEGWHVPTSGNAAGLNAYPSEWLKSDSLWLHPGTNQQGTDIRPAGWYNATNTRFENLLGYTHFWTDEQVSQTVARLCTIMDGCNDTVLEERLKNYGLSVRCVKDNAYSDTQWTEELRKEPLE